MEEIYKTVCNSPEQTSEFAKKLALNLECGAILLLEGSMGAGKSVFARGIIKALGYDKAVTSPTFTLMNEYDTKPAVYHFDLYRLEYPEQLYDIGYEEYLYSDGISIIEWPSNMDYLYPEKYILIKIECIDDTTREITVSTNCSAMLKNATI